MRTPALAIAWCLFCCPAALAAGEPDAREAVRAGLALLQVSARTYTEHRECFSCHHQALPAMAVHVAGRAGYQIDREAAAAQSQFTLTHFASRKDQLLEGRGVPGGPYTAGYALVGLAADDVSADETTAALVGYLLKTQQEDGSWRIRTHRPPLEDSDFTATALAVRGLRLFAPDDRRADIDRSVHRAGQWLAQAEPRTTEDRVFHLFGLKWCDAEAASIDAAAGRLISTQRSDGGWSQLPEMASDAYATGQVLAALRQAAGTPADDAAWQRGVQFLLRERQPDGSWHVRTRSKPIQTYFESGFPHGQSQFISICATAWAVMALSEASQQEMEKEKRE